ncbi:MAG TPA: flagellar biosynthesis protein FlhA [Firmicutes bacterium]|jgi:flagellar biosynthesis protein FlhA|nr:MAG: flagellar biosynthesis protein FlhA [Peptococcaceae bacterium 1109]HHT72478.1 flagellar biosynthesis protein FlhA [Bacillota bacterium]
MAKPASLLGKAFQFSDLYVIVAVVLVVVMMVLPLPPAILDLLLALNISLSLLLILLTMNVVEPLEISAFPSIILIMTLFRVALNISSTRLILLTGNPGKIITAFGQFVVGGNYIVGFVIFLILVIVQFMVITRGSERVAEVAARFTLDAMPGKQMSIDADLNSGLITESEARARRRAVEREADFYGSMDGASKFVKGDAIASIIITLINLIGGFAVGVGQKGLDLSQALTRYTLLSVGDGLVSQIPALLISTATGIIITRAASENNLGHELAHQMLSSKKVLFTASGIIGVFGLVPGLPTVPFLAIAGLCATLAYYTGPAPVSTEEQELAEEQAVAEEARSPEKLVSLLQVDPIELEIGYGLIPLVDSAQGGDMLDRISMIRRQCALELGLIVPVIRIRDNLQLAPGAYVVKIKGIQVAKGELMTNHYLAMDAGGVTEEVEGIPTTEPAFGLDALWVSAAVREHAEYAGYTVVDAPTVLATHLTEIIRSHAPDLLGRQETKTLVDSLRENYSAVIDELIPNLMSLGEVQKVLQNLLREGVPIRNLVTILETLADTAPLTKDPDYLTEYVREALGRQITMLYLEQDVLHVLTLSPEWEDAISSAVEYTEHGATISLDPRLLQSLYVRLGQALEEHPLPHPVVLVAPQIRAALKHLTQRAIPKLVVLSYNEVAPDVEVQAHGVVKWINNEG